MYVVRAYIYHVFGKLHVFALIFSNEAWNMMIVGEIWVGY
jgi:hypothetical protein